MKNKQLTEFPYTYKQAAQHRTVAASGAYAGKVGVGPFVSVAIFSEHMEPPVRTVHEVNDGKLGLVKHHETKVGVVREIETTLVVHIDVLRQLHETLGRTIAGFDGPDPSGLPGLH